jgi:Lrp/AsnC family leucine-responsive transcriptional regulator
MEDAGIILGYRAQVDAARVGLPICAFVRIRLERELDWSRLEASMAEMPHVLEWHNLTGDDCAIVKVAVASIPELERIIHQLKSFGQTTTSIVLSSAAVKGIAGAGQAPVPQAVSGNGGDGRKSRG